MAENRTHPWNSDEWLTINGRRFCYVARKGVIEYVCLPGVGRVRPEVMLDKYGDKVIYPERMRYAAKDEFDALVKAEYRARAVDFA